MELIERLERQAYAKRGDNQGFDAKLLEESKDTIQSLLRRLAEADRALANAEKRLAVQPDETGDADQLKINCDKGLAHVAFARSIINNEG